MQDNCKLPFRCRKKEDIWYIDPLGDDIDEMVKDYRDRAYDSAEKWIGSLETITDFVCGCANILESPFPEKYCKNSHQFRMTKKTIDEACRLIRELPLDDCKDFSSILSMIIVNVDKKIRGFGQLAAFDFSQRYAHHRGITPDVVYLHAGVESGVRELKKAGYDIRVLNNPVRGKFVELDSLPVPIAELGTFHAENFLCIYKKRFSKITK